MSRALVLLLALLLPGGAALGQEAPSSETPPAAEPSEAPAPEEPEPPQPPPAPKAPPREAPPRASREEPKPKMETLVSGDVSSGGFGGPVLTYSRIRGRDALFFGGRGGWIVNHRFVIGGGGFGLRTHVPAPPGAPGLSGELRTRFGYGGLWLEYIFFPDSLIHASFGTLFGGGVVGYSRSHDDWDDDNVLDDVVMTVEPVLSAEMNVIRFLRLSAGVSYRYVGNVELPGLRQDDLTGFTGTVMLKFGRF